MQASTFTLDRKSPEDDPLLYPYGYDAQQAIKQEMHNAHLSNHSGDIAATYALDGFIQYFETDQVFKAFIDNGVDLDETVMLTPVFAPPANSSAAGEKGQYYLGSGYIDICYGTNDASNWLRHTGATF